MANSTRAELRSDVKTELKKDPNGRIWSDAELNNYINKAYAKVQKDGNYEWRENQGNQTQSTVVGTQQYTLPTDFGKIQLVRFNGTDLIPTSKVELKRQYSTFVSGTPSKYYLFGNYIGVDVLPDTVGTLDIDYQKRLTAFTDDADICAFNDDFDLAIVKYSAYLAWSTIDGKQNTATSQLGEYQLELDTLFSTYIFDNVEDLTWGLQRGNRYVTQANVLSR